MESHLSFKEDSLGWLWPAVGLSVGVIFLNPYVFFSKLGLWAYVGFALATGGFFYSFVLRKRRDEVLAIPTAKIRSAAMGMTELSGVAEACEPMKASPFCRQPSIYCKYEVTFQRGKENSKLASYESDASLVLNDGTGKALVGLANADLRLGVDIKYSSRNATDTALMKEAFRSLGITFPNLAFGGVVTCEETLIFPGDPLFVLGYAVPLNDPQQAPGEGAPVLMVTKEPNQYFCISDRPEKDVLDSLNFELFLCQVVAPAVSVICLFVLMKMRG